MARRCGKKQLLKSKCTKHTIFGIFGRSDVEKWYAAVAQSTNESKNVKKIRVRAILDFKRSKDGTPLPREARFEVKMHKTHHSRSTFRSLDV